MLTRAAGVGSICASSAEGFARCDNWLGRVCPSAVELRDKAKVGFVESSNSKHGSGWLWTVFALLVLYFGVSGFKIASVKKLPFYDSADGTGFYWTENAMHFRHTRMVSQGQSIPAIDVDIQYPEGIDNTRYVTIFMEYVAGTLHRVFFSRVPLHVFLVHFSCFFSSLSILAAFLAARVLWRSNVPAVVCAALYAVSPASFSRAAMGSFLREDFALPFIYFSFACLMYCLRKDSRLVAVVGALLLAVALASWHFTQFYVFLMVGGLVLLFLLAGRESLPCLSLTIFTTAALIVSVALPVLRTTRFALSPQMMTAYALVLCAWAMPGWVERTRLRRLLLCGMILLIFFLIGLAVQMSSGSHSHAYSTFLAKLRYLGRIPTDPTKLAYEAKMMWVAGFVTPTLSEIFILLSAVIVPGFAGVVLCVVRWFKGKADKGEMIFVYFAVATFIWFLAFRRYCVLAAFFLSLPVGSLVLVKNRRARQVAYAVIGMYFIVGLVTAIGIPWIPARPAESDMMDVLSYVQDNSEPNEPVLSSFYFGPSIVTYAHRPVILHSMFESPTIRNKVRGVYEALYRSEDDFYEICMRYGAALFVCEAHMVLGSEPGTTRYFVNATRLRSDCAATLFHFRPERLEHFRLVYQNTNYRIFRVGPEGVDNVGEFEYEPAYDITVYCPPESLGDYIDDSVIAAGIDKLAKPQIHKELGARFLAEGDYDTAVLEYLRSLARNPMQPDVILSAGQARWKSGKKQEGLIAIIKALNMDPLLDVAPLDIPDSKAWLAIGGNDVAAGRYKRAEICFRRALELDPQSSEAYTSLAFVYAAQRRYETAIQYAEKALELNPNQPRLPQALRQWKSLPSPRPKR